MDLTPVDRSVLAACAFGASEDQIVRIIVGPQPEPVPLELRMAAMKSLHTLNKAGLVVARGPFDRPLYWLAGTEPEVRWVDWSAHQSRAVEQTFQAGKLTGEELAAVSLSEKVKALFADQTQPADHFVDPNNMVPNGEAAVPDHSPDAGKMMLAAQGSGPNANLGIITGEITFAEGPGSPDCICNEIDSSEFDPPLAPLSDHFRDSAKMMPGVHLGPPPEGKPLGGHIGPAPEPVPLSEGYSEAEEVIAPDDGTVATEELAASVGAITGLCIEPSESIGRLPLGCLQNNPTEPFYTLSPPVAAAIEQAEGEAPPQHQVTGDFTVDFTATAKAEAPKTTQKPKKPAIAKPKTEPPPIKAPAISDDCPVRRDPITTGLAARDFLVNEGYEVQEAGRGMWLIDGDQRLSSGEIVRRAEHIREERYRKWLRQSAKKGNGK